MTIDRKTIALFALAAALAATACQTTGKTGGGARVAGPEVRGGTGGAGTNTVSGGGGAVEPVQTEIIPQISSKAKLLFDDAIKAYEAQSKAGNYDFPGLERKFQAASEADPRLAEADFNLGVLAEKQGRTKEAVGHYKEALSKKPTLRQAAENLGVIAQNSGDEKAAVAIYQDILTNYPDDAGSRARLAEIYRRRGENEKAMELSREALFRDAKTLQAYKTMMLVSYETKQFSMARLIALRASRLSPNDPEIHYTLGLMNMAEKELVKARVNFKSAVEARKDFLPAHYQLAKMAMAQEDYGGAEEHLRAILAGNGKNAEALLNLGVAYKGMGQYDKALQAYDAAEKVDSTLPALTLNRGIIIGLKGEPERAIEYFKKYVIMRGGEVAVGTEHPVHVLIKEQEDVLKRREEDKKAAEEAKKMEEEMKKVEAAAAEEERKKKEEEFKKQQQDAKGNAAKDALAPEGGTPGEAPKDAPKDGAKKDAKKEEPKKPAAPAPKKDEPKKEEPKKAPPPPAKTGPSDEPSEAL